MSRNGTWDETLDRKCGGDLRPGTRTLNYHSVEASPHRAFLKTFLCNFTEIFHRTPLTYIVKLVLHLQKAGIYQGSPVEPKPVVLVEDKDVERNLLFVQERRNMRHKAQQLVKAIPKRNQNGQLWLIARDLPEAAVELFVLNVSILTLASVCKKKKQFCSKQLITISKPSNLWLLEDSESSE